MKCHVFVVWRPGVPGRDGGGERGTWKASWVWRAANTIEWTGSGEGTSGSSRSHRRVLAPSLRPLDFKVRNSIDVLFQLDLFLFYFVILQRTYLAITLPGVLVSIFRCNGNLPIYCCEMISCAA